MHPAASLRSRFCCGHYPRPQAVGCEFGIRFRGEYWSGSGKILFLPDGERPDRPYACVACVEAGERHKAKVKLGPTRSFGRDALRCVLAPNGLRDLRVSMV